jgi:hypothetical protein
MTGATGATGAAGAPGSVWYTGAGAPAGGLGVNGDYYLRGSNSDVYQKTGGAWSVVANIKGNEGQALPRADVSVTTSALMHNQRGLGTVPLGKSFVAVILQATVFCRVQLYSTAAQRTLDETRPSNVRPTANTQHGVILDVTMDTLDSLIWVMSPEAYGSNCEAVPSVDIAYAITNLSGVTQAVTVTFTRTVEEE